MLTRNIENEYNYIDVKEKEILNVVKEKYFELMNNHINIFPPDEKYSISSKGKKRLIGVFILVLVVIFIYIGGITF